MLLEWPSMPCLLLPHEYKLVVDWFVPLLWRAKDEFLEHSIFITLLKPSMRVGSLENCTFLAIPSWPYLLQPIENTRLLQFLSARINVWAFPQAIYLTSSCDPRILSLSAILIGFLMTFWCFGSSPSCPIWLRPHTTRLSSKNFWAPWFYSKYS